MGGDNQRAIGEIEALGVEVMLEHDLTLTLTRILTLALALALTAGPGPDPDPGPDPAQVMLEQGLCDISIEISHLEVEG